MFLDTAPIKKILAPVCFALAASLVWGSVAIDPFDGSYDYFKLLEGVGLLICATLVWGAGMAITVIGSSCEGIVLALFDGLWIIGAAIGIAIGLSQNYSDYVRHDKINLDWYRDLSHKSSCKIMPMMTEKYCSSPGKNEEFCASSGRIVNAACGNGVVLSEDVGVVWGKYPDRNDGIFFNYNLRVDELVRIQSREDKLSKYNDDTGVASFVSRILILMLVGLRFSKAIVDFLNKKRDLCQKKNSEFQKRTSP